MGLLSTQAPSQKPRSPMDVCLSLLSPSPTSWVFLQPMPSIFLMNTLHQALTFSICFPASSLGSASPIPHRSDLSKMQISPGTSLSPAQNKDHAVNIFFFLTWVTPPPIHTCISALSPHSHFPSCSSYSSNTVNCLPFPPHPDYTPLFKWFSCL